MDNEAKEVPLIERLLSVPKNARLQINTPNALGCFDTQNIPVGPLCHEAAAALTHSLSGGGGEAGSLTTEWLFANCRIVFFPPDHGYPVEHNPHALGYDKDGSNFRRLVASYAAPVAASPLPPQAGQGTHGVALPPVEDRRHLACPFDDLPAWRDAPGVGGKTNG